MNNEEPVLNLWETRPDLYVTNEDGSFVLTKAGKPRKKPGRFKDNVKEAPPKKRQYNYHSEVKAKVNARKVVTEREKAVKKLEQKLRQKKATLKNSKETLKKVDGKGKDKIVTTKDLESLPNTVAESIKNKEADIAFEPHPGPQTEFLASSERDILYGGAAGGGKSYAMLMDVLRYAGNKNHRGLILRRTTGELDELIDKSNQLYPLAFPGAKFNRQSKSWTFPSGARIFFGFCEKDADVYQYQGRAYNWIGVDEITQWSTEFPWNFLGSRLRTTDKTLPLCLRATANPGGVGAHWVKKRYVDPAPANETFFYGDKGFRLSRKYIPAKLSDNPSLFEDGNYEAMLRGLPPTMRKQLLEGDWNVVEGAAFPEFDRNKHVIPPFDIPPHWERVKGVDYGYASESACLWAAIDPEDGTIIIYRELYMKGLTGDELGSIIREMEASDPRSVPGVLDTAAWSNHGKAYHGPTVGEVLLQQGHKLRRADKARIPGKIQIHERLKLNMATGRPKLQIFSGCPNTIRELESIPLDKRNPEDVDTHADDHAYDALRYLVMSRPRLEGYEARRQRYMMEQYVPVDSKFGY